MDPIILQPETVITSEPHKHFLNKKFAITFVILILLGAGAYAGIWYWGNYNSQSGFEGTAETFTPRASATTDPTADWKTYTNTQYGFEFKYPATWVKVVDMKSSLSDYLPANGTRTFTAIYPTTYPAQDYSGRVDVYSVPKTTVLKDDPYIKNETKIGDVVISGTTWTKFSTPNGFDYFSELNNKTYEVSGSRDITDQILATFKFTK